MAADQHGFNLVKAVNAFSRKLERFTAANPAGNPSHSLTDDEIRQKKVDIHEQAYRLAVINLYKKYRFPYKTLGQHSPEAESIASDEQELLSAYKLYKSIVEANAQFRTSGTCIRENVIASPLCSMEQYTLGDDFIYLQCWLMFEQHAKDFIPRLSASPDGSYILAFQSAKTFRFDYKAKEVMAIIKSCFYPGEK